LGNPSPHMKVGVQIPLPTFGRKNLMAPKWVYFKEHEVEGLDHELVAMLDRARHKAGIPFLITSGKRTAERNRIVGGEEDSSHMLGLAVDLKCSYSGDRYRMLKVLLEVGFNRIGIYNQHLHCDLDRGKIPNVIWAGTSK